MQADLNGIDGYFIFTTVFIQNRQLHRYSITVIVLHVLAAQLGLTIAQKFVSNLFPYNAGLTGSTNDYKTVWITNVILAL